MQSIQPDQFPTLKEIRPHGTKTFPCAMYQTRAHKKGRMVKHHWHDEIEIIYFSRGGFCLEINMKAFSITGECLYFINPGELHSIASENDGYSGEDAIVFHPGILSFESCDATQIKLLKPIQQGTLLFPRALTADHPAFGPILSCFWDVMRSFGQPLREETPLEEGAVTDDLTNQLFIKSSLLRILALLSQNQLFTVTSSTQNKRVEALKTVITYIKQNYQEKIYVGDLANLVSMNQQYFCRFFKKAIGRSPMEYVNEYRIKQSIRLLEETDLSVITICLECGFHNLGNFLREFKKYSGTTPLQYRKSFPDNL